ATAHRGGAERAPDRRAVGRVEPVPRRGARLSVDAVVDAGGRSGNAFDTDARGRGGHAVDADGTAGARGVVSVEAVSAGRAGIALHRDDESTRRPIGLSVETLGAIASRVGFPFDAGAARARARAAREPVDAVAGGRLGLRLDRDVVAAAARDR